MIWPDTMTYSKAGSDMEPFFRIGFKPTEENPESSLKPDYLRKSKG